MRLDRAIKLNNFLEVNINSKFIVLIIGHSTCRTSIYEIGRVIATCLADEVFLYFLKFLDDANYLFNFFLKALQRTFL